MHPVWHNCICPMYIPNSIHPGDLLCGRSTSFLKTYFQHRSTATKTWIEISVEWLRQTLTNSRYRNSLRWGRKARIRQTTLAEKILQYNQMHDTKPLFSLTSPELHLSVKTTPMTELQAHEYRSIVGTVLYLDAKGRPDVCIAVSMLDFNVAQPTYQQKSDVKRVLRYMKGTEKWWCSQVADLIINLQRL